ncbi:hypothetical protein ACFQ1T_12490 [Methylophilus glucosoxydans]|uniref:Uncharacterized protein n=1 Tax=Methylophilus glucosoxydans TaxID=752553 RepID=A0ABW3GPA0_9PROT
MSSDLEKQLIEQQIELYFPGAHPRAIAWRTHLISVCKQFIDSGLADSQFVRELTSSIKQNFWARLSEALIARRLKGLIFNQRTNVGEGPDFLLMHDNRKVWIEAICPEPINVPEKWLSSSAESGVVAFPHREILLRWTGAIQKKAEALMGNGMTKKGYLESGLVGANDAYIIAVNGCQLRSGPFPALFGISQSPFAVEAVFPIGPYEIRLDKISGEVLGGQHQHRPEFPNHNNSPISTTMFTDPKFQYISAIWALDLNGGESIGNAEPTALIHNPLARNPIPLGLLPADEEFVAHKQEDGFELSKTLGKPAPVWL